MTEWEPYAARLAEEVAHPVSRWHAPLAATPRHLFVPRWWANAAGEWTLQDGPSDPDRWMTAAYANRTLVTRVGPVHADLAKESTGSGLPTSSSTLPSLVVDMYRHAMIADDSHVLVTTGSGYGTALACQRLQDRQVTSLDVDAHLVKAAAERLDAMGLHPGMAVCDITGPLSGRYDRIIATVSLNPVPASCLSALRPGGRLVTTLAGTGLIITADKVADGGAVGRVEQERAGFMRTRHAEDYAPGLSERFAEIRDQDGEDVTTGRYPVLNVQEAWDVWSMLELTSPGIEHRFWEGPDHVRTAWMVHADGSWARAQGVWADAPTVHQGGPRRLWDDLERIRNRLNTEGGLPLSGARVRIDPDGTCHISRGAWSVTLGERA
ncbi:protein-L-isoaspartate(D-aspartate) O-methyltransferase [Streptomyces sp. NPDC059037]|uniref:protein-L-isoaspartate(D-aspartate) O-methyltransferase n=1 Tax=Streptomyces sp. NPDC059037 TaxID=3346710 RepID=UPI0036C40E87